MRVMNSDGVEIVLDETYREPEHGSLLDQCAMFTYQGESLTLPLGSESPESMLYKPFVIVLAEKGKSNHYRLVDRENGKLCYLTDNLPTMGLKDALAWKSAFKRWEPELKEFWKNYDFKSIMPYTPATMDWLLSYMPKKRSKIDQETRMKVYQKCGGHCAYCGKHIEFDEMQVDHVESHYRHKGKDEIDNYLPACRDCNGLKSDYMLEEFREILIPNCAKRVKSYSSQSRSARICEAYGLNKSTTKKITFYFERMKK